MKQFVLKSCLAVLCAATLFDSNVAADPAERVLPQVDETGAPRLPVGVEQILGALSSIERGDPWTPEANDEISRGPAAEVYPKVAPATVVIRLPNGHGTGFLISDDGWIVTNHHVASEGLTARTGGAAGTQFVYVHLGSVEDGVMTVDETPLPAIIYKLDADLDLALLKLFVLPKGVEKLPFVKLSEKASLPGTPCVAIGHPKSGMLWTVRSGEVAGLGTWPKDMINVMMNYLSVSGSSKDDMAKSLANAPKRKVVISSCGINPGDSGGPLVNEAGELVAVTFAIPKSEKGSEISLDKFSYHVHVDELRNFIKDRPETPPLHIPTVWPPAVGAAIVDSDEDGANDTWFFFHEPGKLSGSLIDADQDSGANFLKQLNEGKIKRDSWDAELITQFYPMHRSFYDKDNDGKIDEILTDSDRDGKADVALRLIDGKWKLREAKDQPMYDVSLFADEDLQKRVQAVWTGKGTKSAPDPDSDKNATSDTSASPKPPVKPSSKPTK